MCIVVSIFTNASPNAREHSRMQGKTSDCSLGQKWKGGNSATTQTYFGGTLVE